MARGTHIWHAQLMLLCRRQIKLARRQPITTILLIFAPVLALIPLLLLKWTAGPLSMPECHKRPIALPSGTNESTARYLQSVFCGFDLPCMSERDRQINPNIYYERSILPRWWADLLPLVSNENNTRKFSELLASAQVFLEADSNWHSSKTVRQAVAKWVDEIHFMAQFLLGAENFEEEDEENASDLAVHAGDELQYVLKKAQQITRGASKGSGNTSFSYADIYNVLYDPEQKDARNQITSLLLQLAKTGLFSVDGYETFLANIDASKLFLRDASEISMRYLALMMDRVDTVKQTLRRSHPSTFSIPPISLLGAMYKTSVCGVDVVAEPLQMKPTDEITPVSVTAGEPQRSKMSQVLDSLAEVIAETRFDAAIVLSMLKSLMGPELYEQQMPRELLSIQTLLDETFRNNNKNSSVPSVDSYEQVCSSFEREASRLVLGNMFYSMIKPLTNGRILYYSPEKRRADVDAILQLTNDMLRPVRLTLSYPLQILNLFTNIGYARQTALSPQHDRLLTKILSKAIRRLAITIDGGDAGPSMSMDDLSQLLLTARDLISEIVIWLRQVMNVQKIISDKCLPWQSNVYAERVHSLHELEVKGRDLESKRELLSAVDFSPADASSGVDRVSYQLVMDVDRMKALPSMSGPMDEMLAAGSVVGDIQYYLGFLPLQNILDRAIMQFYGKNPITLPFENNSTSRPELPDTIYLEAFPRPCSNVNVLSFILQRSFQHILVMLGIAFGTGVMTRQIVADRERMLDRLLRLHGLRVGVRSCSWWITWLTIWALAALAMLVFQSLGGMLPYSSELLQFMLLFSVLGCNMGLHFAVSGFFDRPVLAAGVSVSIVVFSLVPSLFRLANSYTLSYTQAILLDAFPLVPYLYFTIYTTRYESAQQGLQFSNWMYSTEMWDAFSPRSIFLIVLCYTAIYIGIGAAVRLIRDVMNDRLAASCKVCALLPKFCATSKWCCCGGPPSRAETEQTSARLLSARKLSTGSNRISAALDVSTAAISIRQVSKVYKKAGVVSWLLNTRVFGRFLKWVVRMQNRYRRRENETGADVNDNNDDEMFRVGHLAVRNVSLTLLDNEIACVVGPNGAGKSTLMALMCGFLHPTNGDIELYGETLYTARARNIIGYCPQNNVLLERMTVREHLEFFSSLKGYTGRRRDRQVDSAIRRMELEPFARQYAQTLSGGYQRRLMMALAFACGDNRLIVLDEPCAGVDPAARNELWQLISRQRQPGYAVVVNTHHLQEAECFADRVVIMKRGKVCVVESMPKLCEAYTGHELHNKNAIPKIIVSPLKQPTWQIVIDTLRRKDADKASEATAEEVKSLVQTVFPSAVLTVLSPPSRDDATPVSSWQFTVLEKYSSAKKKKLIEECLSYCRTTSPPHHAVNNNDTIHSESSSSSGLDGGDDGPTISDVSHTTSSNSVVSPMSSSPGSSPMPPQAHILRLPQSRSVADGGGLVIVAVHFKTPTLEDVCKAVQIMDDDESATASAAHAASLVADDAVETAAEEQKSITPAVNVEKRGNRELTVLLPSEAEHIELPEVHNNGKFSSASPLVLGSSSGNSATTTGRRSSLASIVSSFNSSAKHPTRFVRIIKAVVRTRLLQSSIILRQAFALACKRLIHYSRTYQRTAMMLAIPLAIIFLGTSVARSTQRSEKDNRIDAFLLDPMSTFWAHPTFYAYEDTADEKGNNDTQALLNILQNDADFNTLNGALCSRCGSSAIRRQQMRQLRQQFLISLNYDPDFVFVRSSDRGHKCAPIDTLPLPAETTHVKQATLRNIAEEKIIDIEREYFGIDDGVVTVHVDLPRRYLRMPSLHENAVFVGGPANAGEDVLFIKPRNTMVAQLFGGYTIIMSAGVPLTRMLNESSNATVPLEVQIEAIETDAVLPAKSMPFVSPPSPSYIKIWHNTAMGWSASQYLTRMNSALFKWQQQQGSAAAGGRQTAHLEAFVRPLPLTHAQIQLGGTEKVALDTAATMMFVFGMTFVPAFAIAYVVAERQRGERKVQLLGGVSSSTYWITSSLFDYLLLYSLIIFGSLLILTFWPIDSFSHHDKYFDALFTVISLYGLNALAMSYLLSYLFHDPHVAFVSIYALLCCAGFVAALLVNPANFYGQMLRDKHKYRIEDDTLFMWLIPSYNMGQAIVRMLTQKFESFGFKKVLCSALSVAHADHVNGTKSGDEDAVTLCERALSKDPFEWNTTGRHINAMAWSTVVFLIAVIAIEWLSENWSAVVGAIQWRSAGQVEYQPQINEIDEGGEIQQSGASKFYACLTPPKTRDAGRKRKQNRSAVEMTANAAGDNGGSLIEEECVVKCDHIWHSYKVSKLGRLKNAGHIRNRRKRRQLRASVCTDDETNDERHDRSGAAVASADEGVPSEFDAEVEAGNSSSKMQTGLKKVGGIRERDYIAKNVSIDVRRGESCALFGYNGAGKTTVFRCLTGQVTPLRGRILFNASLDAKDLNESGGPQLRNNSSICRNRGTNMAGFIGYCPQTEPLEEHCTIYEHLLLYSLMKNVQVSALAIQIAHVLRYVAIGREFLHGPVAQSLSGGTRRKLSAAMALLNRPRLVLMDEATAGVDALAREAVAHTLACYAREQRAAVVFTSHNVADACASSRIAVLSNGRIVLNETMQAINERFLGRFFHIKLFFRTTANAVGFAGDNAVGVGDALLTVGGKEIMPLLSSSLSPSMTPPPEPPSPSKQASRDSTSFSTAGEGNYFLDFTNTTSNRVAARIERILHKFYATLFELNYTVHSHQMSGRMLQMIVIAPPAVSDAAQQAASAASNDHDIIKKARKRAAQSAKLLNERLLSEDNGKPASPPSTLTASSSSPIALPRREAKAAAAAANASPQMQLYRLFFDVCRGHIDIAENRSNEHNVNNREVFIEEFFIEPSSTEQILTMLASENASDYCDDGI